MHTSLSQSILRGMHSRQDETLPNGTWCIQERVEIIGGSYHFLDMRKATGMGVGIDDEVREVLVVR